MILFLSRFVETLIFPLVLFALIKSIKIYKLRKPLPHFKALIYYFLIGIILISLFELGKLKIVLLDYFLIGNRISLIFHFSFFSYFIFKEVKGNYVKNALKLIIPLFTILTVYGISYFHITDPNTLSSLAPYAGLFLISIIYFFDLFNNIPKTQIKFNPSFWIILGVFLGTSIILPTQVFGFFIMGDLKNELYQLIYCICWLGFNIMYCFFIKGLSCLIRNPSISFT